MKRDLFSLLLLATMWLWGSECGSQTLSTNGEGAYLIGSKADLQSWTKLSGYEKTNVLLTADIGELDFRLCTTSAYAGTFDGGGHTITLNYDFKGEQTGMFGKLAGTVKNLVVDGNVKATYKNCAALAANTGGNCTFENVVVTATFDVDCGGNASNGAFIGYSSSPTQFVNCVSAYKVTGVNGFNHGFVGWVSKSAATSFTNCVSIMETGLPSTAAFANPMGSVSTTNCYCYQQNMDASTPASGVTYLTQSMVTSGELCYLLCKNAGGTVFFQSLGSDPYPVPFASHKQVYGNGNIRCDGTPLDGELAYSNENTTPKPQHVDVDGRCSVCNSLLPDHIALDEKGYYPLATAKDVEWFAALVNEAHLTTICGKLTADIDFQGVENAHSPIGQNVTYKFNGKFDGQGHRIKNMTLNSTGTGVGFFGYVRGGTVISNLIIDKSCEITGANQVGGIIGTVQTDAGSPLVLSNCVNEATVFSEGSASGLIGSGASAYPVINLIDCINAGEVTGNPATAFCSWINKGGSLLTNCVNVGTITGAGYAGGKFDYKCNLISYEPGTVTLANCYDLSQTEECGQGIYDGWATDNPAGGGELCYLLNGDQATIKWYQRVGTDAYPMPLYIEGGQVYANGSVGCDGTPTGDVSYSNQKGGEKPPHEYEDGFCVNCGTPQADYVPMQDGHYLVGNASQLDWIQRMVNEYKHGDYSFRLTQDIDMTDCSDRFLPMGNTASPYTGHFDGQGHRITNLIINATGNYVGFFGVIANGAVIENALMDETCSISGTGECVAFVGGAPQGGTVVIRNIGNMANVSASGKQASGIFGANTGSRASVTIENCFSTGQIVGSTECAAIAGWAGSNSPKVSNCWSCSEVIGNDRADMYLVRHGNGSLTNLYSTAGEQGILIEYDNITDGSLCYKLNGDQTSITWFQNLDNGMASDDQPVPFANGHARVYPKGKMLCDGTTDPTSVVYSNNNEITIPPHSFEDGFCKVCGQEDADFTGFVKAIKNPDFNADAFAWEGTDPIVANGVASVTAKTFDVYQPVASLKPGVYRLRVQGFARSAALSDEAYASGTLADELLRNVYVYAESNGQRVARRLKDVTADAMEYKLNDGQSETRLANDTYVPADAKGAAVYMGKGKYWNDLYFAVTADTTLLGFCSAVEQAGKQMVVDRLRLIYMGDDDKAYSLIAKQVADDAQELGELEGQENLKEEYAEVVEQVATLTSPQDILDAADKASRYPDAVKLSVAAYASYKALVAEILLYWQANAQSMSGDAADRLETYLTQEEEPSEEFPNGTSGYITEYRQIGTGALVRECDFARLLLADAVKEAGAEGMDVTPLITNPRFTEANWKGWTVATSHSGSGWNLQENSGFTDVFPVAAGYNTAFEVSQEITGLKDGIYELRANAFHRPGVGMQGLYDGTDVIPARLFLNEFATPVKSVYADIIDYADAVNGVNCRYDSENDASAPHNGEQTASKDMDILTGYVPDNVYTAGFAFNGHRYLQSAYAVVRGGTLRLGIRNGETPWRNKNLTIWGDFHLTYHGTSSEAVNAMLVQYSARLDTIELQRVDQQQYFSVAHSERINSLIGDAQKASDTEGKLSILCHINSEFVAIDSSKVLYSQLLDYFEYANAMADDLEEGELKSYMMNLSNELGDILYGGTLTDGQVRERIAALMDDPRFGGVIYVQGDLLDPGSEDGNWDYSRMCTLYPLYRNAEGKWTGTVTLQDRSRMANSDQRAGLYFRRVNTVLKCDAPNGNFITPAHHTFGVQEGGTDYQALNGTYDITLDLDSMTVDFRLKDEYRWASQVYVTGTLANRNGGVERWKNTEQWPLQHVGDGRYVGTVDMVHDNANPYCSFGIMACRSNTDMANYSTTARKSWTEARYGSATQYLDVVSGERVDSLVRGLDRTWHVATAGRYLIEFDMNHSTLTATLLDTKGRGTQEDPYLIANAADLQGMQGCLEEGKTTCFRLTADIDLGGNGWYPVNSTCYGNSTECPTNRYVALDGDGHVVKNVRVFANKDNHCEAGFFGVLCGEVKNIGFYNAVVDGGKAAHTGVLAGVLGREGYEGVTCVMGSYFHGKVNAQGNAGGIAGMAQGEAKVANCYANAAVSGDGSVGDLVGANASALAVSSSYGAGKANGSPAEGFVGQGETCEADNVLYYDGQNREAIAQAVSAWAGWSTDGAVGNGYPLLEWQVKRGDYTRLCGFPYDGPDAVEGVAGSTGTGSRAYTLDGVLAGKNSRGVIIVNGRKVLR